MIIVKPYEDGWIVINQEKAIAQGWENAHTHLKSKKMALTIKRNVETGKMPRTRNPYLLTSHVRVSRSKRYQNKILELIETRARKSKKKYININKGAR